MWFYKLISYLFHPVFLPFYGAVLYFNVFPHTENPYQVQQILIYIFLGTVLLPILFLSMLKYFKLIQNFQIPSINERRLPLLFFLLISFLTSKFLSTYRMLPDLTIMFIGITFIALIAYVLISFRFKISLHAISIGGVIGVILALSKLYNMNLILLISLLFMLSGIILTARLSLKAHNNLEVYLGFLMGIFLQYGIFYYYSI
ncbi:MAG: hypothetical protein Q7U08_08695 [Flavobacteriaceae bacterium]|jgi:hypothetical protein|nr:hypothetical protein [Flavobacteriaceae bacterium]